MRSAGTIKDLKSEVSSPHGAARATALMTMAQAVQEFIIYLRETHRQLNTMRDGVELQRELLADISVLPTVDMKTGEVSWHEDTEAGRRLGLAMVFHSGLRLQATKALAKMGPVAEKWLSAIKTHFVPGYHR